MADKLSKAQQEATLRSTSHGRGGAGNINARPTNNGTAVGDLETPTLKGNNYTTGRGGTGNIVPNDKANPSVARAAQDVETPAAHGKEARGTYHWGRGGEGNMVTLGSDKKARSSSKGEGEPGQRRPSMSGLVGRGKSFLGLGKKEGEKPGRTSEDSVAVDDPK